jgi:POTRA domain-containing FtsQ-type protein
MPDRDRARPARTRRAANVRLRVAVAGVALVAVVGAGSTVGYGALQRSSLFDVRTLAVTGGDAQLDRQAQGAARDAIAGRSLLALDRGAVIAALEQLPRVASATVDRDFPSTLKVTIVPERAVAIAVHGKDHALLSASGRVLKIYPTGQKPGGLPKVGIPGTGFPKLGATVQDPTVHEELAVLPAHVGVRLGWVKHDASHGPILTVGATQIPVYLGDASNLTSKVTAIRAILELYPMVHGARGLQYIDVSSPRSPAVMQSTPDPDTEPLVAQTADSGTSAQPSTSTNP